MRDLPSGIAVKYVKVEIMYILPCIPSKEGEGAQTFVVLGVHQKIFLSRLWRHLYRAAVSAGQGGDLQKCLCKVP